MAYYYLKLVILEAQAAKELGFWSDALQLANKVLLTIKLHFGGQPEPFWKSGIAACDISCQLMGLVKEFDTAYKVVDLAETIAKRLV